MKTLHLLRHAKTIEGLLHSTDHARFLTPRGVGAAKVLAEHMAATDFSVDMVLCSTARRAGETYELITPSLKGATVAHLYRLYLVQSSGLFEFIHGLPDKAGSVLIIGHNPGLQSLAVKLCNTAAPGMSDALAALKEKYPTCTLCSLVFDITQWRDMKADSGTLNAFVHPKDADGE